MVLSCLQTVEIQRDLLRHATESCQKVETASDILRVLGIDKLVGER
jgi:hypothetical protein